MDFHFHIAVTVTDYTVNIKGIFQQKTSEPKQNKHLHGRQRRFCVCTQNFIFNSCYTFCNGHFLWKLLISFLFIPWQQMIWCRDRSVFLCVGGEHVCKYWVMLKRSQHWRPQYKTWWTVRSSQTKCATFLCFAFGKCITRVLNELLLVNFVNVYTTHGVCVLKWSQYRCVRQ